jgi:hypothetical protein
MRNRKICVSLAIVAPLFLAISAVPPLQSIAHAASVWFNGYGADTYASYGPDATVSISGDLEGGCIDMFGQFSANVYVVPHGSVDPNSLTTMSGQPNAVITSSLTGGLFEDETIGFTMPDGHLGTGNYDIVLDACNDGVYNPDTDMIAGSDDPLGAFGVDAPANIPGLPPSDIATIKSNAGTEAGTWVTWAKETEALFAVYDAYSIVSNLIGSPAEIAVGFYLDWVCAVLPPDPNGAPVTWYCPTAGWADIMRLQAAVIREQVGQAAHYKAISNDPPDPNYGVLAAVDPAPTLTANTNDPLEAAVVALGNHVGTEAGTLDALLHSLEKYQGAQQAGDANGALLQATAVQQYASMLSQSLPATSARLGDVAGALQNSGLDFGSESNTLVNLRQRLATSGFTADETAALEATGLSPTDVGNLLSILTETATTNTAANYTLDSYETYGSLSTTVPTLESENQSAAAAFSQLASDMQPIIAELTSEIAAPQLPTASAGGPYTGTVGSPLALNASASTTPAGTGPLSYAWDLTGTGSFADAFGPAPSFTYSAPYTGLAAIRVTNAAGQSALGYALVTVTAVNRPPVITALSPTGPVVNIANGTSEAFSATTSDAENDPLTYQWTYDGALVSTTNSYSRSFGPSDAGLHVLQLTVSDPGGTATRRLGLLVAPPPRTLTGLSVLPVAPSVRAGTSQQLTATATYSDGSTSNVTNAVSWTSSVPGVGTVSASGLATGQSTGSTVLTAELATATGSKTATATLTVTPPPPSLTGMSILPINPTQTVGGAQQFTVIGQYSDGSTADLTGVVSWSSASSSIASISTSGVAGAVAPGVATITAVDGSFTASTSITVVSSTPTLTGITVTPTNLSIAIGIAQQFTATGQYSDGSSADLTGVVIWSSTVPSVASITSGGLVTGAAIGGTTIQAVDGAITGSTPLNVSQTPPLGNVQALYVTERFNRGIAKVTIDSTGHSTINSNFVSNLPGNGPDSVVFDHHGNMIVSNSDVGTLSLVDPVTGSVLTPVINSTPLRTNVADLALDPQSDTVWAIVYAGSGNDAIYAISLTTGAVRDMNPSNIPQLGGIAFNSSGSRLFVSSHIGEIDEISPVDGHLINSLFIGGAADGMTFDPTSGDAFVSGCGTGLCQIGVGTDIAPTLAHVASYNIDSDGIAADGQGHVFLVNGFCCLFELTLATGTVTEIAAPIPTADDVAPLVGAGAPPTSSAAATSLATSVSTTDFHDLVTPTATLTETAGSKPVIGARITFALGNQSCAASTDSTGTATCSLIVTQTPGTGTLTATFAGTSADQASTASAPFTITTEETTIAYAGATTFQRGSSATLTAALAEDGATPIGGRSITLTLGSGNSAQSCGAKTDATGLATCTIASVAQPLGASTVSTSFSGDAYYNAATASAPVSIAAPTMILYAGRTTSDHADGATLEAQLVDTSTLPPSPIPGATVNLSMGGEHCAGTTNANGEVACSITPMEPAGAQTVYATFAGDATHFPSTTTAAFNVTGEETSTFYIGPFQFVIGSPALLIGRLDTDGTTPLAGRNLQLTLGTGPGAQSCSGTTDAGGTASCTIASVTQPAGPGVVTAAFAGDGFYLPSSEQDPTMAFSFLGSGSFVIGNRSAVAGTKVDFWGAQWAHDNVLSGGTAPPSFKGFANNAPNPPAAGQSWTTNPGNSSGPPTSVPQYIGVLITSQVSKSGSTISGNTVGIAVVSVDPGYGAAPGHPGTGTIVAVLPPPH